MSSLRLVRQGQFWAPGVVGAEASDTRASSGLLGKMEEVAFKLT